MGLLEVTVGVLPHNRVGGGVTPAVRPHHRVYGTVHRNIRYQVLQYDMVTVQSRRGSLHLLVQDRGRGGSRGACKGSPGVYKAPQPTDFLVALQTGG